MKNQTTFLICLFFFLLILPLSFAAFNVNITDGFSEEFYQEVSAGNVDGYQLIHKFGATLLDTTIHPATYSTFFRTPTSPIQHEFLSDSALDTSLGIGAREITIECLNSSFLKETLIINTSGLTPVALPNTCYRIDRWFVSASGSYANETIGSHYGALTIRQVSNSAVWSIIPIAPYPTGQSQIAVYTCEKGKTAYLLSKTIFVDSVKTADVYFFRRDNINDTTAPYSGTMRLIEREVGVTGGYGLYPVAPKKLCVCPCDMGYMGKISVGTSEASFEFEILLVDNNINNDNSTTTENDGEMIGNSISAIAGILAYIVFIGIMSFVVFNLDTKKSKLFYIYQIFLVGFIFVTSFIPAKIVLDIWVVDSSSINTLYYSVMWFIRAVSSIIFVHILYEIFTRSEFIIKYLDKLRR